MSNQKESKRPIFVPVVLVLLVFSVTFNVLLYTKNIQHNRERLEGRGVQIFQTVVKSKEQAEEMISFTAELLEQNKSQADITRVKAEAAAKYLAKDQPLVQLQQYAEESTIEGVNLTGAKQNAEQFVQKAAAGLQELSTKTGQWSAEEEQLVVQLNDLFKQILDQLSGFPYSIEGYSTSMIRLANGYELVPISEKINSVLTK